MATTNKNLTAAVEDYFADLRRVRASGGATGERSSYGPLANLLNAVGATLKPKVFCVGELAQQGAGHPDFGLYTAQQVQRGQPREGQLPERGVVEVKALTEDTQAAQVRDQTTRYWARYHLVLVTNLRDFELLGPGSVSSEETLEAFRVADSEAEFVRRLERPRTFAGDVGAGLSEYLCRALSYRAALVEPKDVAWLLASYARDGLARVEAAGDSPSLVAVRAALEDALGVRFEGERGARFFQSTLVQTLFYGVFSAWVLWSRDGSSSPGADPFSWREAVWHLRAPVLRALFQQLSDPGRLRPLGLVEVLDWTSAALDRVDRAAFFKRFREGEAVPYFYEPFLEAFDPTLRKQLGVWYTPTEVVRYMVARVDRALKDDLGIADGLAADNVYVLDPCCGTGAYLAEVLRRINANLQHRGLGALAGARVKQAATQRVFGFEIMPAPYVVAHLQVGLTMQELDASLDEEGVERPGVFLTNALTGWEPEMQKPLPFPELEEERDRAGRVKQDTPILVILGNPPYNGFAGMAVAEERELSEAYRTTKQVRRPEGQGLNDLYVRFFRMAERRIAEKTGQGVISFISNYSWLEGLSFTGMRERYLEAFDVIRIDCLNGDKYKTGKVAPDGSPDPSIFSTPGDPVGIQVGTAITTLVRKAEHVPAKAIHLRHLWGQTKREQLSDIAEAELDSLYDTVDPILPLGLPYLRTAVGQRWFDWPTLPDLFPVSFPGVQTKRDAFLIDIEHRRLRVRISEYFDAQLDHEEIARRYPSSMHSSSGFALSDGRLVRERLLKRGGPRAAGFVRHAYRPFDNRWLYWETGQGLLGRPVPEYIPHVFEGNAWISAAQHLRRDASEPQTCYTHRIASLHLIERTSIMFPLWLLPNRVGTEAGATHRHANLSNIAQRYLEQGGIRVDDLFYHVLAVLHDPSYRQENAGALRLEWPRIPLPGWPSSTAPNIAPTLSRSAARGRELASLLDVDTPVPGVTQGALRPELSEIAVPTVTDGRNMSSTDFAVTTGWGHYGVRGVVMPGRGRINQRAYTHAERVGLGDSWSAIGETTYDVYLNDRAYWRNIPATVWTYRLGGYQVLKKWLSYRAFSVLDRPLLPDEVQDFTDIARRIGAILLVCRAENTIADLRRDRHGGTRRRIPRHDRWSSS